MFAAGDLIAGKFQIDQIIGQGGMGFVVAATHVHLGQRVALKFLLPELATDRAIVERFLREARSSAQLRSEHVCRVSDVGVLDTGAPYFVMELLEGRDLASLLAERGPVPIAILTDYVLQACLGLAEAHAARIVHRDLKPANLFLTLRPDGTPLVKIVDFGIAKDPTSANFQLTRTDAVMGSPGYMSPEQLRSTRAADARSDLWALGVILYELSSGRPPFSADSITDLALRIAMDPTPPLRTPSAPPGFDQVVYRCLEKDPARRFQDVAQLASALAPFGGPTARERALGVARVLSAALGAGASGPAAAVSAAATTLESSAASLERRRGSGRRWGLVLGACAAAVVATVGFVTLRGGDATLEAGASSSSAPSSTAPSPTVPAPTAPSSTLPASSAPPTASSQAAPSPAALPPTAPPPTAPSPITAPTKAPLSSAPPSSAPPPITAASKTQSSRPPPSSPPSLPAAPRDAGPAEAASPPRAPATVEPISRPRPAPPVRKVSPRPPKKAGSDDDFEGSRL